MFGLSNLGGDKERGWEHQSLGTNSELEPGSSIPPARQLTPRQWGPDNYLQRVLCIHLCSSSHPRHEQVITSQVINT